VPEKQEIQSIPSAPAGESSSSLLLLSSFQQAMNHLLSDLAYNCGLINRPGDPGTSRKVHSELFILNLWLPLLKCAVAVPKD
jgi:hypothetical protein